MHTYQHRLFSIFHNFNYSCNNSILSPKFYSSSGPCPKYHNVELNKAKILEDNRNRAGVYRWVNNINNKTYIGSSINLSQRFYKYLSVKHLTEKNTPIHNALLKYGLQNFTLEILEYCEENKNLIKREQHFLDKFKPEYNILKVAGSSLGFKHSEETLELFKNRKVSEETKINLSLAATGRVLTKEERLKISQGRKGIKLSYQTRVKISDAAKSIRGITVLVKNIKTSEVCEFVSLTDAASTLGVSRTAIRKYLDTGKFLRGQYLVSTNIKHT